MTEDLTKLFEKYGIEVDEHEGEVVIQWQCSKVGFHLSNVGDHIALTLSDL